MVMIMVIVRVFMVPPFMLMLRILRYPARSSVTGAYMSGDIARGVPAHARNTRERKRAKRTMPGNPLLAGILGGISIFKI